MIRPTHLTLVLLSVALLMANACQPVSTNQNSAATTAEMMRPYQLRAGDVLRITVWKEEGMDQEVTILTDGTVDFPLIGSFTAAGLTTAEVQAVVTQKLQTMIPSASVTVLVKEALGNSISVLGQVARPGDIVMNRPLTIMQALSQVGGLTNFADEHRIVILRKIKGVEQSIAFDYSDVANGERLATNIILEPGDVIVVPTTSLF